MKIGTFVLLAATMPGALLAQEARNVPAGNPLGTADASAAAAQAQVQTQRAQMAAAARSRANAQAMAEAFAPTDPAPDQDEGRRRTTTATTFGQPSDASVERPARQAASPYGGYYQIRTPWDRR